MLAAALLATEPSVIAAAAGDIDDETSCEAMHHGGTVVYLRVPHDELVRRIGDGSSRPIEGSVSDWLAATEAVREPRYEALADLVLDVGGGAIERDRRSHPRRALPPRRGAAR